MFLGHPAGFFRDGKTLFRDRFFHGKPLTELRPGYHIYFGAFLISFGAAVVVPAFQRRIILQCVLGNDVRNHIQFDVVMVPKLPFRSILMVHMPKDQHAVMIADQRQLSKELSHGRIEKSAYVVPGLLLLPGKQNGHSQVEPACFGESDLHRNGLCNVFLYIEPCPGIAGISRQCPHQKRQLFAQLLCLNGSFIGSFNVSAFIPVLHGLHLFAQLVVLPLCGAHRLSIG